jgi:hypothetical protein
MSEDMSREEFLAMSEEERASKIKETISADPFLDNMFSSMMEGSVINNLLGHENEEVNRYDLIPWDRATIRKEYRSCRSFDCPCQIKGYEPKPHPKTSYLYAYWKEKGKLKKKYIGRSIEEYKSKLERMTLNRKIGINWTYSQWDKYESIKLVAGCGSEVARKYLKKFDIFGIHSDSENDMSMKIPSIDWAYRKLLKALDRDPELRMKVVARTKELDNQ